MSTVVVVDKIKGKDSYGSLLFTDKGGTEHKLGNKRSAMFTQIIEGRAVELSYSEYQGKSYISNAKLVELPKDGIPNTSPSTMPMPVPSTAPSTANSFNSCKDKPFAVSYAKDVICAIIQADPAVAKKGLPYLAKQWLELSEVVYLYMTGKYGIDESDLLKLTLAITQGEESEDKKEATTSKSK